MFLLAVYLLADAETLKVTLQAGNMILSACVAIGLYFLGQRSKASDRKDEALNKEVATLRAKIDQADSDRHAVVGKLVDERFRNMTHEIANQVGSLLNVVEEMKVRLKDSETDLDGLGDRDHRIELALAGKIDSVKDYIRDNAASKGDLEKHQVSMDRKLVHVDAKITKLGEDVAVLNAQGVAAEKRAR